jgi:hypothetical protein
MPTEKAHGYQIAKVLSELAALGNDVELWVPYRKNSLNSDIFNYYSLKENFNVKVLGFIDAFTFQKVVGAFAFRLQSFIFITSLFLKFHFLLMTLLYIREIPK